MSSLLKLRRGSTVAHETFTGADGEVTFNTDTNQLVSHDGATAGGFPHVKSSDLTSGNGATTVGFTPVGTLASTNVQSAIAEVVSDLAASAGTSLVGYMPTGTNAVATTLQKKLQETVSVKDFKCADQSPVLGNGSHDDVTGIQAAIDHAFSKGGGSVFFPSGMYKISASLVVKENVTLVGDSRFGTSISATTNTITAIVMNSPATAVHTLTIRDADIGIRIGGVAGVTASSSYYGDVFACHIAENRIGISAWDSYMTSVHGCKIVFNGYGVIIRNQSYAMNVYDNEIGNCTKGVGVYISGSAGCIIRDNGIEGCRNIASNNGGVGLMVLGSQRTLIEGNWFEANYAPGNIENGADVIIGNPAGDVVTAIIANCIPTEYQAEATANSSGLIGPVYFHGNFHYSTRYGYLINSTMWYASVTIENPTFVGVKNRGCKAIVIKGTAGGTDIKLRNLSVLNTADNTIDAEMNVGIKNTCVFVEGTIPAYEGVTLDGMDLFTATVTVPQLLALSSTALDINARRTTSGSSVLKNGAIRALGGIKGFISKGANRVRLDTVAPFVTNTEYVMALFARSIPGEAENAGFTYYGSGGPTYAAANDTNGITKLVTFTPTTDAEAYISSGEYYGRLLLTKTAVDASILRGCTRINVTELNVISEPLLATTVPTAWSSAASYTWAVGDIVYNSATAVGGPSGWVCTVAGSPGTWESFGIAGAVKLVNQTDTVAADLAALKVDFNLLLGKLRTAKLM